ncbi:hypothetical protein IAD21_04269 [Abditibacteriota bacterium]|nr:hypothetical protein IAD21_04269 [Abditibacteriota bacterium]
MIRYFAPLAAVLALATTAHAQTYSRTYTTSDGRGNSTTTTIEAPASVAGLIAGQTIYGGFPSYANNIPSYAGGIPSYGANCPPGFNGGYAGYTTVPAYGYGYNYSTPYPYVPQAPCPYPYGYAPQTYYVPGQTTYLPHPSLGWNPPPAITTVPQVIVNPAVPPFPYGAYAPYGYGYNSRTTVAGGGITYRNNNGITLSVGGSTTQTR